MKRIVVFVRQEHIDKGGQTEASCPITLAVREALHKVIPGKGIIVRTRQTCIDLATQETLHTHCLSNMARIFVTAYDDGKDVWPLRFTLTVPEGMLQ